MLLLQVLGRRPLLHPLPGRLETTERTEEECGDGGA